ncbi:MAG TPA: MBL fold metallo-hydrolase [Solirubrobacteraceae bacterium]|nr:MBL fold metallo-hydrolase [Solirubrobacteraceae bacterium]
MRELAPDVWHIGTFPPYTINAYLLGDVLVDALTRRDGKRILKALDGRKVTAHALTHAHADHQGASHAVCSALGIPFWVGAADADAAENPKLIAERQPSNPIAQGFVKLFVGPGHPVDRQLREGDDVAGFEVIDVPGHSSGHVAFWRESDRVLVLGDVVNHMDTLTLIPKLTLPRDLLTPDPERNRQSAKRLGELEPDLVLFGHGKPLRDREKFWAFCAAL